MKGYFSKIEYEFLIFSFLMLKMFYELPYFRLTLLIPATIIFCVLISYVLAGFIRDANDVEKKTVIIFVAFLLGGPVLSNILFTDNFIVRESTLRNLFFLFCLFFAFESITKTQSKWRIPVICFICCAIQPAFVFIIIPTIVILLLHNFYLSNKSTESVWLIAASLVATVVALLLFGNEIAFADNLSIAKLAELIRKNIVFDLIIVLPFVLIINTIWINIIKNSKDKKFKLILILIVLEPLISSLSIALDKKSFDFVMASVLVQVCFFFYLLYIKNAAFHDAFTKMMNFFEQNTLLVLIILIYISAFSLFGHNSRVSTWLA